MSCVCHAAKKGVALLLAEVAVIREKQHDYGRARSATLDKVIIDLVSVLANGAASAACCTVSINAARHSQYAARVDCACWCSI